MENYMTAREAAEAVGLSEQTIRRYVLRREIPFHKINRAVRFKPSEIEKWVGTKEALPDGGRGGSLDGGLFMGAGTGETMEAGDLNEGIEVEA